MGLITGIISDKDGKAMNNVSVVLMNENFEEMASAITNEKGEYCLNPEANYYPFLCLASMKAAGAEAKSLPARKLKTRHCGS